MQDSIVETHSLPSPTHSGISAFWAGIRAVSPLLMGVLPFALIAGSSAASVSSSAVEGMAFSVLIFAGASQLAACELLHQGTPVLLILITVWVVNLRMLIYSAVMSGHFRQEKGKALLAYLLTDQAFAISISQWENGKFLSHKRSFYLGTGFALWFTFQVGSLVGILVGAKVPPEWSLDFAIPLSFIALLVPSIRDKASFAAAFSSAILLLLFAWLPMNLGLLVAIFGGLLVGWIVERTQT